MTTEYQEIAPPPELRDHVECFWTTRSSGPYRHRVLPDGCIDILFDFRRDGRPDLVGTMTRALLVEAAAIDLVAVRFRPGGAAALLGFPAREITDRSVALDDLAPDLEWRRVRDQEGERRVDALAMLLRDRLAEARPVDRRVAMACRELEHRGVPIEMVAKRLGLTRQHLTRLFQHHVGIGAKHLARVYRLQRALDWLANTPDELAAVALEAGYSDQPHLNLDCRELAGVSPGEWLRERG